MTRKWIASRSPVNQMKSVNPLRRLLFIFPPTRLHREGVKQSVPALGAGYLAAVSRDKADVAVIDAVAEGFHTERDSNHGFFIYGLSMDEIAERIKAFNPDFIGITCLYSSTFPVVAELCSVAKTAAPDAITMAGGTHPAFLAEQCLRDVPDLDLIALGEGELILLDLLDAASTGRPLNSVSGIAFRDPRSNTVVVNRKPSFIEDLDSIPFPAWDLLPMERYQEIGVPHLIVSQRRRFATMITSRGCPARCTFCSSWNFWGNRYRARSANNVLNEIEYLKKTFGTEEIQFEDDNISLNRQRFQEIVSGMIERDLNISWSTPNGIALWSLDRDLIRQMKKAGCYELALAFESGCQDVLDTIIRKPLKLERAEPLVHEIHKEGIRTSSFFIVGFPGETLDQMRQTFALPRKLGLTYAWFFIANPLPGSEIYELCRRKGYLVENFDFVNNSFSRCNIHTPEWEPRDVERLAHREFIKFNLYNLFRRPGSLLRRYKSLIANPGLVVQIIRSLIRRELRPSREPSAEKDYGSVASP